METTTTVPTGGMSKMTNNVMPLAEVFEQMSHGKVSGDNWMIDDCGNLKIMLHNTTAKNLDDNYDGCECCGDLAVFDVKVMIATNCLQKKAWGRAIEYSKEKYSKHLQEEEHLDISPNLPKEIIINL